MNEQLLDTLNDIAAEYAPVIGGGEHFVLDRLEHYPGILPFSPQPLSADSDQGPPSDAPFRISPELAAVIAEDIQRHRSRPNDVSADPIDQLASQLDTLTAANNEQGPIFASIEESQSSSPDTPESPTTEEPVSSDATPAAHPGKRRKRTFVVLLLAVVGGVVGGLFLLPYVTGISTTTQPEKSDLPSTEQRPTPPQQPSQQISSLQQQSQQHSNAAAPMLSVKADTTKASSAGREESLRPQRSSTTAAPPPTKELPSPWLPNRVRRQPELTVVSPPAIEYPSGAGKFSVQVCSTPSYAEAIRWKERLERQGTYPVSIIEYRIRDNTYYRVRVGSFSSQIQAQQAVSALGLSHASIWIVRIE